MNDEEFYQVPQTLFNGVDSFVKNGVPGSLVPLTNDTCAVLSDRNPTDVIIVAVRYGQGRCLVFSCNGYMDLFKCTQEYKKEHQAFVDNCKQWVSKGLSNELLEIEKQTTISDEETQGKILLWSGHNEKDDAFNTSMCEYLQSGGALICAVSGWDWLEKHKGKDLSSFSFSRFCDNIGVKITRHWMYVPDPIVFEPNLVDFKNVYQVMENLKESPGDKNLWLIIGAISREFNEVLPGVSLETLENVVTSAGQHLVPAKSSPVQDQECREQCKALCSILCILHGFKAPGVASFPGDFDQPPCMETDLSFSAKSTAWEWHCTGYYVPAGVPIQIDVVQQEGSTGWSARIGCHSDSLQNCHELRRWHCISICKSLTNGTITMSSAFGGLLFLESPDEESSSITVNIHNVVLAPTYDLLDSNRADSWKYKQENAQGLWADIAGKYIVFNVPSTSVLDLDNTFLDRVLELWDSVALAHHELSGTKPTRRERVVCDEQISAGYMHCGYPIATHLDISDPKSKDFVFIIDNFKTDDYWGLFHELGHNRQRAWWTFGGTGEVTVNIFSLHAIEKVCHMDIWSDGWLKGHLPGAYKYIENGSNFSEWKQEPGVALFIYAQLAREYGWDSYKAVFRTYEEKKPNLNSDEEKIDCWITTFSRQVGYNLIPLFKFWGFPVSQSVIDDLGDLEIPAIRDELIERAPERYNISV